MALPHHLTITGSGFDAGEFFYGCNADITDGPPGSGSRGLAPGEDALSVNFNRAAYALAENDEHLYGVINQDKARLEVAQLTFASPKSSIVIDPSSGGGGDYDLDPAGFVFLGGSDYVGGGIEDVQYLFQLLDQDYNPVVSNGTLINVNYCSPMPGSGFYNSGLVTLFLTADVPAGNYRLLLSRDSSVYELPEDAPVKCKSRYAHEHPNYAAFTAVLTDGAVSFGGDYNGTNAVDVLDDAAYGGRFSLKNGYYQWGALTAMGESITLIGESLRYGASQTDDVTVLSISAVATGGVTVKGRLENVFLSSKTGSYYHTVTGGTTSPTVLRNVRISPGTARLTGDIEWHGGTTEYSATGAVASRSSGCEFSTGANGIVENVKFYAHSGASAVVSVNTTGRLTFRNCRFDSGTNANCPSVYLENSNAELIFENCHFEGYDSSYCVVGNSSSARAWVEFRNCEISNDWGYLVSTNFPLIFKDCQFYTGDDNRGGAITGVDTATDKFVLAGDHSALPVGHTLLVDGSTGNDGYWTVASTSGTGPTEIFVNEDITDATLDGTIYYSDATQTFVLPAGKIENCRISLGEANIPRDTGDYSIIELGGAGSVPVAGHMTVDGLEIFCGFTLTPQRPLLSIVGKESTVSGSYMGTYRNVYVGNLPEPKLARGSATQWVRVWGEDYADKQRCCYVENMHIIAAKDGAESGVTDNGMIIELNKAYVDKLTVDALASGSAGTVGDAYGSVAFTQSVVNELVYCPTQPFAVSNDYIFYVDQAELFYGYIIKMGSALVGSPVYVFGPTGQDFIRIEESYISILDFPTNGLFFSFSSNCRIHGNRFGNGTAVSGDIDEPFKFTGNTNTFNDNICVVKRNVVGAVGASTAETIIDGNIIDYNGGGTTPAISGGTVGTNVLVP